MSNWQMKAATAVVIGMLLLNSAAAQSQPTVPQSGDQSGLLSTVYVPPNNFGFQEVYDLLRQHNALEKIKGDTQSVPIPRAINHRDHRMRRGEFLLSAKKFQADGDDLLRIFETYIGIATKRSYSDWTHPDGCGGWTVFLGDFP